MANSNSSDLHPNPILAPLLRNTFQYRDQNNQWKTLNLPGPARIAEHVILHPELWTPVPTVRGAVTHGWEDFICAMCDGWGHNLRKDTPICPGAPCVASFTAQAVDTEFNRIELRVTPSMGLGVFARTDMPAGRVLGQYLGELRPEDDDPENIDHYQFTLKNVAVISAKDAGNWTRFVNHHCNPNLTVHDDMYGLRRAILFKTRRAITAGEELTVSYGDPRYFEPLRIDCRCDAYQGPHQLGGRPALFAGAPAPAAQYTPFTGSQFMQISRREASPEGARFA